MLKIREYTHPLDRKLMRAMEMTRTQVGGGRLVTELLSRLELMNCRSRRCSGAQSWCHSADAHIAARIAIKSASEVVGLADLHLVDYLEPTP